MKGTVRISTAIDNQYTALVPIDATNVPRSDNFDVMALLTTSEALTGANVALAANATQIGYGYQCLVTNYAVPNAPAFLDVTANSAAGPLFVTAQTFSSRNVTQRMLARLVQRDSDGKPRLRCRIEHGAALGAFDAGLLVSTPALTGGFSALIVWEDVVDVHGIALYLYAPDQTCPAAEMR
jgi:hypothetical protein